MATLQNIIKISRANYDILVGGGSITIGGVTYTYDENALYLVDGYDIDTKQDKPLLTSATNYTVLIGKIYDLGVIDGATIVLDESGAITNECPDWHFFFTAGSNAPVWGGGISIIWDGAPTFTTGKLYEIDIMKVSNRYLGLCCERTIE